jgi:HAD superfamily hydrolase (TIGR01549 family)
MVRRRYGLTEPVEELPRAGWRLGIVTNGEADNQLGKIERTGLDRLVDSVAVSGALGVRKPDAEIFRIAAEGAGCALADGGWMVGDNAHADVGGGAAVGLRTVWIGAAGEAAPQAATTVVGDVVEAIAHLLTYR